MFPIHNITGRVIGFGGRTLKTDKNTAKYFNSPESEIYHKSDVLYGMYQAKQAIVKLDECFLVEGYTDVISMHQSGVENVVASSGTSLTEGQIKLIKRYTKNVSILYDGDAAGIKASFRGIDMLLKAGMNIKVVLFPEGEDPDSFAKKSSAEELRTYISEKAEDFLKFKSDVLIKDTQNDPLKRAETIKEIVKSISVIPDAITRQVYIRECSDIFDIDENTLLREVDSLIFAEDEKIYKQQKKQEQRAKQQNTQVPTSSFSSAPPGFDVPPEIVIYDEDGKPLSVAPAPAQEGNNFPGAIPEQNVPETLHQEKGLIEALLAFGENEIGIKVLDENQEEQNRKHSDSLVLGTRTYRG